MAVQVGDRVRIAECAREEILAYRHEGPDTDALRENRVGVVLEQLGVRGRHLLIVFRVDFGNGIVLLLPEEILETL